MNHFCLDVLQRITIPDFLDFMRSVFPVLYAIDADNKSIVNLHVPDKAYFVMYEHVIQHRFPNLVGGFSREIKLKLDSLNLPVPDILNTSGEIKAKSVPETVSQRERFEGVVTLTNKSGEPWHCNGIHPVLLSYHWLNAGGSTYQYDGIRTTLTCETILPDKQFEETVYIIAPEKKGHFQLVLTLVQEGICWFEDKDFRCATVSVIVG
ncbi:hypothetical protein BuS5_03713 [Desulfosarcina sp. BuS5]|nr:hypothetical protein [Desulfosarcina sp. BuS5]WDN90742.1 hypothetical protein BuS5_03713 [Desulfosarcina sp. BuS5]